MLSIFWIEVSGVWVLGLRVTTFHLPATTEPETALVLPPIEKVALDEEAETDNWGQVLGCEAGVPILTSSKYTSTSR